MAEIENFNDFLKQMRKKFPQNIKDDFNYEVWTTDCVKYLYNPKVDYAKLYELVVKFNPNGNFIPDTAWLYEQQSNCYKKEAKKETLFLQVKIYNPIYDSISSFDCFPKGTSKETMIKTYEKITKVKGWKVLEVF